MSFITQGKTNWKLLVIVIILAIIVGGGALWYANRPEKPYQGVEIKKSEKVALDPKNCTYTIEGKSIALKNGYSEEEIVPGSASKAVTQYFGNEASSDLNKDGLSDVAFILTQNSGGTGTFYYVAVALGSSTGCKGTNAILLGDRIAPQTTQIKDGIITVNYADRKTSDSMTTPPSVGITKEFMFFSQTLNDVTSQEAKREQACAISGGTIKTSICCKSASDFPNSCLIGACGCSPTDSHQVKTCDCGIEKCFNGEKCIGINDYNKQPSIEILSPKSPDGSLVLTNGSLVNISWMSKSIGSLGINIELIYSTDATTEIVSHIPNTVNSYQWTISQDIKPGIYRIALGTDDGLEDHPASAYDISDRFIISPTINIKPVINSLSPQEVSIGSTITIKGDNFDPIGTTATTGWMTHSHIFLYIKNSLDKQGILFEAGSLQTKNQITVTIPSVVYTLPEEAGGGGPSITITPGNYLLSVSVDGRGTSNIIPISIQ